MALGIVTAGRSRINAAIKAVIAAPMRAIGLMSATILVFLVFPLWGFLHPMAGWHKCRERMAADGLTSLGEVLVPDQALLDYKDGIWRGLYRVHTSSFGFVLLQMPVIILLLVPVFIAQILFTPVGDAYPADFAQAFQMGPPGVVALSSFTIIFGQTLLATKVLGMVPPSHPLGTSYVAISASWRGALRDPNALISIGLLTSIVGAIGGGFGFINDTLAGTLELAGSDAPMTWILVLVAVVASAVLLEALGQWSDECDFGKVEIPKEPYQFLTAFWGGIWWGITTVWNLIVQLFALILSLVQKLVEWIFGLLCGLLTLRYHRTGNHNKGGE